MQKLVKIRKGVVIQKWTEKSGKVKVLAK